MCFLAQHRRLHSALEWVSANSDTCSCDKVYRQEKTAAAAAEEPEAGEDQSSQVDTIGDCELRSLLICYSTWNSNSNGDKERVGLQ